MLLVAACRPPIGVEEPSAGETITPSDTPPPAAKLKPDNLTNVQIRLFRGLGPADAALLYGQALDSYREANLTADISPPIPGYDPFAVEPAEDSLTLWVGTVSDVAPAVAAGLHLTAVGELSGRDPTILAGLKKTLPKQLSDLESRLVVVDTAAAGVSLQAAVAAAGADPSAIQIQPIDDPSAPFDPTPLLDGTVDAAAVSDYDGWARTQELVVLNGDSLKTLAERPIGDDAAPLLGELVWAQQSDVDSPALGPAVTALLGVLGQTQLACRDAVEDCAGVFASQSDRTPEGLAWSIDQVDRTLFPATDGILHIDPASWDRTIAAMTSAGVPDVDRLEFTNKLVDAVVAALGSDLDLTGATWKPRTDLPLFPE
jgi:ABC-type nitrate/sulfonate/bicarbonate transport system substrate-binding protein